MGPSTLDSRLRFLGQARLGEKISARNHGTTVLHSGGHRGTSRFDVSVSALSESNGCNVRMELGLTHCRCIMLEPDNDGALYRKLRCFFSGFLRGTGGVRASLENATRQYQGHCDNLEANLEITELMWIFLFFKSLRIKCVGFFVSFSRRLHAEFIVGCRVYLWVRIFTSCFHLFCWISYE